MPYQIILILAKKANLRYHTSPVDVMIISRQPTIWCRLWCDLQYIPMIIYMAHAMLSWWRHQMETFSALLALCAGNSPVTGEFPSQRPVTQNFDVLLFLSAPWINGWVNNREAGDLRRHRTRYDVIMMILFWLVVVDCARIFCGYHKITPVSVKRH